MLLSTLLYVRERGRGHFLIITSRHVMFGTEPMKENFGRLAETMNPWPTDPSPFIDRALVDKLLHYKKRIGMKP